MMPAPGHAQAVVAKRTNRLLADKSSDEVVGSVTRIVLDYSWLQLCVLRHFISGGDYVVQ